MFSVKAHCLSETVKRIQKKSIARNKTTCISLKLFRFIRNTCNDVFVRKWIAPMDFYVWNERSTYDVFFVFLVGKSQREFLLWSNLNEFKSIKFS